MKLKVYEYKNCSTCRNALKFLSDKKVELEILPIRETPPKKTELKTMLKYLGNESKRLFNTSGNDYKELGLKNKLGSMSLEEQLDLLSKNGNLVKRPFVLGKDFGFVGFKEEEWKKQIR
ncbi:arsenate reductase family protein [Leptospira santarosai]|uniref:arsenate reductase family protein n=1 Tax=Leptospira santarosai TaxID=28183 RepID=UPI00062CF7BA|nr:arsenate reductase family protein [Leptospira santarosai]AVV78224.1 Transcriptional regulator, Spx/MgsR family [Leptospira santarosai]MBW9231213.1 arsenate reductase family protein [Leptospira santarosai]MDI7163733.1 arsenate reductase family protein [Leptospira santarosai]MDI7171950.1 arsenate reductase family protein [Leptospira santarosai]MDI7191887.1 arsenate reductase family protein [Leptospira santarosai]